MGHRLIIAFALVLGELCGALVQMARHFQRLFRGTTQRNEQRSEFGAFHKTYRASLRVRRRPPCLSARGEAFPPRFTQAAKNFAARKGCPRNLHAGCVRYTASAETIETLSTPTR